MGNAIENIYIIDGFGIGDATTLTHFFMVNDAMADDEKVQIIRTLSGGETYAGGGGASERFWLAPHREVNVGDRFVLTQVVERYPHFSAPVGLTGTVVEVDPMVAGKMDLPLKGAEEWDNEIMFGQSGEKIDSLADFCWSTRPTDAPIATPPKPQYRVAFPDFGDLDVDIPNGFTDSSWHNDACPSWTNEALHLQLFVDFADLAKSEMCGIDPNDPSYGRFQINRLSADNQVDEKLPSIGCFKSYDEALAVIIGEQFAHDLSEHISHRCWLEMQRRNREYANKGDDSCASHEFCDPNMVMQCSMEDLGFNLSTDDWAGEETDESKRLVALWNAAWAYAKRTHFTAP